MKQALFAWLLLTGCRSALFPVPAAVQPGHLVADAHALATLSIHSSERPSISFAGNNLGAVIESIAGTPGDWKATVRAGVMPGRIALRVESPGYQPAVLQFEANLDPADSGGDGTPDFLRLDEVRDRKAFRSWFNWLAEAQYFLPPQSRRPEIDDCAALIRYAYREALRSHDSDWANAAGLPEFPTLASVSKYHYPYTPLGANLFRVKPGPFAPSDLTGDAFLQFADAQTLWRANTHLVSRDLARAVPGDLLFFRRGATFHGMIYLGESAIRRDGHRYLLYHTGPTGSDPGEIRRPTVEELMRFPQPEWRPEPSNRAFLGVMRWNILRRVGDEADSGLR